MILHTLIVFALLTVMPRAAAAHTCELVGAVAYVTSVEGNPAAPVDAVTIIDNPPRRTVEHIFTLRGAAADIRGTAATLDFAHRTLSGDGPITAPVASTSGTEVWTMIKVMLREPAIPDAADAATGRFRSGCREPTRPRRRTRRRTHCNHVTHPSSTPKK